jgi:uncharacterized protein (TIGR03437 family)
VATAWLLLAALLFRSCLWAQGSGNLAPAFPPDSVVNSASGSSASLTPNVLATLFGTNLAFSTAKVALQDFGAAGLPTRLAGVSVVVGGSIASLLMVSPTQVNFLMPANLLPGPTSIVVIRDGTASQAAQITLLDAAPALFMVNAKIAATHADGTVISAEAPAQAGETIVMYGTGLGRTDPRQLNGAIPRTLAPIAMLGQLQVLLDGQVVSDADILYAGITPGSPGVYQIKLRLPGDLVASPGLQVVMGDQMSQDALTLPVGP